MINAFGKVKIRLNRSFYINNILIRRYLDYGDRFSCGAMMRIRLSRVKKYYYTYSSAVVALRDVNLAIDKPGLYAVEEPSGNGKTTLL